MDDEGNPILDGQGMPPVWIDTTGSTGGGSGSGSSGGGGGGGGGGFGVSSNPKIEVQWANVSVSNGESLNFSMGGAEVGVPHQIGLIRIINTGDEQLELKEVTVSSVPDGLFEITSGTSTPLPQPGMPIYIQPEFSDGEGDITSFTAVLSVVLDSEGTAPTGTVTVRSNSTLNNAEVMTFTLSAEGAEPSIQVTPSTVEFGNVSADSTDTRPITILNTGTGDLVVSSFVLSGNDAFAFLLGAKEWFVSEETASTGVTLEEPLIIKPGTASSASIRFSPVMDAPAEATLILFSNDPDHQSGTVVPISGNLTGPCISINPKKVNFGGKLLDNEARVEVEILSCGESPLTISGVSVVDVMAPVPGACAGSGTECYPDAVCASEGEPGCAFACGVDNATGPCEGYQSGEPSSVDFGLDMAEFVGDDSGAVIPYLGPNDTAVVIPVNGTRTFDVMFTPDEINKFNPNVDNECTIVEDAEEGKACAAVHIPSVPVGTPIPDLGMVRIKSDAFDSEIDVEVKGFGVATECPTAVIIVTEGAEVIPQTKLHLIGSQSFAANGNISKYEWSVKQPVGSQSVFLPSGATPSPTFEVNVAGIYEFTLKVWDQDSEESCEDATYTVFVNPDEAIHVELLWHTPLDPDETDEGPEAGADLDLHFVHPFAVGMDLDGDGEPDGWFDQPFDCFWFNDKPNWGSFDPDIDDDPSLDRDDTNGAGPENVNLNLPHDGRTYRVGVHYWNDHDFGPSLATVRVYIYSSLVFQLSDVELIDHDMWEVADIAWPSGQVTLKTDPSGSYKITPQYNNPFFPISD